mmetsp:Transcript_32746/g.82563  ORF Transcript_32746/g.82563 Transcript_32746/m.82563 type:complete len:234 (-) Transcript_32746:177-878(-)
MGKLFLPPMPLRFPPVLPLPCCNIAMISPMAPTPPPPPLPPPPPPPNAPESVSELLRTIPGGIIPGGIMRSLSSPSCPRLLVLPGSSESKKDLSEAAEAATSAAACADAPARPVVPSYAGCGAPPGVSTQHGAGRPPPMSKTRSIRNAPCCSSWSSMPTVDGSTLKTNSPSARMKLTDSWHMTRSAQSTPIRITAISPRLVTRVCTRNALGPSAGSVTTNTCPWSDIMLDRGV